MKYILLTAVAAAALSWSAGGSFAQSTPGSASGAAGTAGPSASPPLVNMREPAAKPRPRATSRSARKKQPSAGTAGPSGSPPLMAAPEAGPRRTSGTPRRGQPKAGTAGPSGNPNNQR
jgi:hypothetical protein